MRMWLKIEIELDNAAFSDPYDTGEDAGTAEGRPVAGILRDLAGQIEDETLRPRLAGFLRDGNGVRVLTWEVTED